MSDSMYHANYNFSTFRESRAPISVQFLDRIMCDVFVIQASELGMVGDVTVFRTNSGG